MFCEKCGTKNLEGTLYCENCGARMVPEEPSEKPEFIPFEKQMPEQTVSHVPFPKKKMSIGSKIGLIAGVILIAAIVGFFFLGKLVNSPEKIIENYMDAIIERDYAKAYECYDIKDSDFVNSRLFVEAKVQEFDKPIYKKYQIDKTFDEDSYLVTATTADGLSDVYNFHLIKQSEKKWLFFDSYKIYPENLVAKNCKIVVPADAEVYIGGVKVDKKYLESSSVNGMDTYDIPEVLALKMGYRIDIPYSQEYVTYENLGEKSVLRMNGAYLSKEARKELEDKNTQFINDFITTAINKGEFDTLGKYFSKNYTDFYTEEKFNEISEKGINEEGTGITEIKIEKSETKVPAEFTSGMPVNVYTRFEFSYSGIIQKDGISEEISSEELSPSSMNISYVYEDNEWKISGISMNLYIFFNNGGI